MNKYRKKESENKMKKILIDKTNGNTDVLIDDDLRDIATYAEEVSMIFSSSKIVIFETTTGCMIIRPSQIESINISDLSKISEVKNESNEDILKD